VSGSTTSEEESQMIEMNLAYDLLPGVDPHAWEAYAKKATAAILRAPGIVEFRAHRAIVGSPQVLTTTVWKTVADWGAFAQGAEWQALEAEMRTFVTNVRAELWGPSPVMPEPLRPGKQ
jgi:heme-degrading monooxygenase HmoA